MNDTDMAGLRLQGDVHFLLNPGGGLDWLDQADKAWVLFQGKQSIIGEVGTWFAFRGMPQAMPAIDAPLIPTLFPHLIRIYLEFIPLPDQTKADDARTDIRGDNEDDPRGRKPV